MTADEAIKRSDKEIQKLVMVNEAQAQTNLLLKQLRACIGWLETACKELEPKDAKHACCQAVGSALTISSEFYDVLIELHDKMNAQELQDE